MRAFIDMEYSGAARFLLRSLVQLDKRVVVPDILYAECANVAWKYVRLRGLPNRSAEQYTKEIVELGFHTVSSLETATSALHLALSTGASVYDASYGVVALQFDAILVTADSTLIRKLAKTSIHVAHLSDFATT
jgi:predicted nucleic acid-binding protein